MSSTAKAQEPTMEEILASIRRIISDDAPVEAPASPAPPKPVAAAPAPKPAPKVVPEPEAEDEVAELNQDDIDAVFAALEAGSSEDEASTDAAASEAAETEAEEDVLELTDDMSAWDAGEEDPDEKPALVEPPDVAFEESDSLLESEADEDSEMDMAAAMAVEIDTDTAMNAISPASKIEAVAAESLLSPTSGAAVSAAFGSLAHTILSNNPRTLEDLVREMLRPMLKHWLDENLPTLVERMVRAEIERVSRGK